MKDLVDFKNHQIEALQKRNLQLETWLLEVTDKDCPSDYKRVIRTELLNNKIDEYITEITEDSSRIKSQQRTEKQLW